MSLLIDKIFSILSVPPGNLAYHLVVVFALAAAFQSSIRLWPRRDVTYGKRLVGGLFVLLGLQLLSFFAAAISWLGIVESHVLLPPLDRLLYLFGSLVIVWLWLFPESRRTGDISLLLLAFFAVTGFALSLIWWGGQQSSMTFNGTWPDQATHIFAILLYIGALTALLFTRPAGWGVGTAIFVLLFLGHILALLVDPYEQDFSGGVRLAQMAAYPWLIYLSTRFGLAPQKPTTHPTALVEPRRAGINPVMLHEFVELATLDDPEKFYKLLPQIIGRLMGADICMLLTAPDPNGQMSFPFGYNLLEEKPLDGFSIDSRLAPEISGSMLRSRTVRIASTTSGSDATVIARAMRIASIGGCMIAPLPGPEDRSAVGLLLFSPLSNRVWSMEDQTLVEKLTTFTARLLNRMLAPQSPASKSPVSESQVQELQKFIQSIQDENKRLTAQLEQSLASLNQEKNRAESLAALVARQEEQGRQQELSAMSGKKEAETHLQELTSLAARLEEQNQELEAAVVEARQTEFNLQQELASLAARFDEQSQQLEAAALAARQAEQNHQQELAALASLPALTGQDEQSPSVNLAEFETLQVELQNTRQLLSDLEIRLAQAESAALEASEQNTRISVDLAEAQLNAQKMEEELASAKREQHFAPQNMPSAELPDIEQAIISPDHASEIRILIDELRQPLSSISGYTEMLLGETMGILGTLQRKFLERIHSSVERITSLIDDLSQISTLAERTFQVSLEPIDLNKIIDEAIIGAMSPLREKNLLLRVDIPDDLPEFRADQQALQQILSYLLQNAGLCTPAEGEVTLRARAELKKHEPGYMLIQVSDSGCGISPEDLREVFTPVRRKAEDEIPGTGVNAETFAAVKMLVEAHQGRIWVDSAPGQGATFSAVFPLASEKLGAG